MVRALAVLLALLAPACSGGSSGEPSGPDEFAITPATLPQGTVGNSYSVMLGVQGGSGTGQSWIVTAGTLPAGLAGLPANGSNVPITGTPTNPGPGSVTIEVRDSDNNVARITYSYSITPIGGGESDTTLLGAPTPRGGHTAIWTGTEMLVWGGIDGAGMLGNGAAYNPATDRWRPLATLNAPAPRTDHTAIWTGSRMIVWGGFDAIGPRADGHSYDPLGDRWVRVADTGAPIPRNAHTAVWTGSQMIVYGGQGVFAPPIPNAVDRVFADGGVYSPGTDAWSAIALGGPAVRDHTAIWNGVRMIVWGGHNSNALTITPVNIGSRYNVFANTWLATTPNVAPSARTAHTAVWTGGEMLIWGGRSAFLTVLDTGSRYASLLDRWTTMNSAFAAPPRMAHTAVWTGTQMVVWGGTDFAGTPLGSGGIYTPGADLWSALPATFTPTARTLHTAVWTGTEMIVWGGRTGTPTPTYLNDGARLTP